jgi:hypothetical protein
MATKIMKNTNGNLWKIRVETRNFHDSREYVQAIYKYCPNIKYASVYLTNENLDELGNLLASCQHLEGIYVELTRLHQRLRFDVEKFLDLLVKFAPTSLYKVYVDTFNRFKNTKSLDLFFDNWKGRKILHLYGQSFDVLAKYQVKTYPCKDFWKLDDHAEWIGETFKVKISA